MKNRTAHFAFSATGLAQAATLGSLMLACSAAPPPNEEDGDPRAASEQNFTTTRDTVSVCGEFHRARKSVPLLSTSMCDAATPFAITIARECVILWGTQARAVCAYSSPIDTGCGPVPMKNAAYCSTDDLLVWDQPFLHERARTQGEFAAVAAMAHEWGHLNQQRAGLAPSETRTQKSNELHADCHAGVFAAVQELQGHLDVGDAKAAFDLFCRGGDPVETAFTPNSHGTCSERQTAFLTGYQSAKLVPAAVCSANALAATVQICARY